MSELTVERTEEILVLTFNRPERANAINEAVNHAVVSQLEAVTSDQAVRAVVLTAAGTKCFCAGADLKEYAELDRPIASTKRRALLVRTLEAFIDFPKPLVAAVQAQALGAGLMLAALADEVIAVHGVRLGMPEIRHGMPSPIGIAILAARAGWRHAERLVQLGDPLGAVDAHRLGLVDEITSSDRLRARAMERARTLGALPGDAFAANKIFASQRLRMELAAARRFIDAT